MQTNLVAFFPGPAPPGNRTPRRYDVEVAWRALEEIDYGLILVERRTATCSHANHLARHELSRARFLPHHGATHLRPHPGPGRRAAPRRDRRRQGPAPDADAAQRLRHPAGGLRAPGPALRGRRRLRAADAGARQHGTQNLNLAFFSRTHGLTPKEEAVLLRPVRRPGGAGNRQRPRRVAVHRAHPGARPAPQDGHQQHPAAGPARGVPAAGGAGQPSICGRPRRPFHLWQRSARPRQRDGPQPQSRHTEALAARGSLRSYRRGLLLIQEGDVGSTLYIVHTVQAPAGLRRRRPRQGSDPGRLRRRRIRRRDVPGRRPALGQRRDAGAHHLRRHHARNPAGLHRPGAGFRAGDDGPPDPPCAARHRKHAQPGADRRLRARQAPAGATGRTARRRDTARACSPTP